MAVGDRDDVARRLRAVLPARWFPDTEAGSTSNTPVLDAVLAGIAEVWAAVHGQLSYVALQARIATATDVFLDMVGTDFFGRTMKRRQSEEDSHYRARLQARMLRPRGTRSAMKRVLLDLTGREPAIFEPMLSSDTRGWGSACGWGTAGGWGSLTMPYQCLVIAFRPQGGGVSEVSGWGVSAGGWGGGIIEYATASMQSQEVNDTEITAAVAETMPAATIAWMRISN
jgi:hypothetical protein